MIAAKAALAGTDIVGGCLYFYAPALSQGTWIKNNRTYYTTIGCHRFYGNCRIQGADLAVQQARLALCIGVKNVICNVLTMFKINVPEKM